MIEIDVAAAIIQRPALHGSLEDNLQVETLATRRSRGAMKGYWEFPGGKRESEESISECLVREIREELGIEIEIDKFLSVHAHTSGSRVINLHAFLVTSFRGKITLIDHDEMRWLCREELDSLKWSPADIPFVQMLK